MALKKKSHLLIASIPLVSMITPGTPVGHLFTRSPGNTVAPSGPYSHTPRDSAGYEPNARTPGSPRSPSGETYWKNLAKDLEEACHALESQEEEVARERDTWYEEHQELTLQESEFMEDMSGMSRGSPETRVEGPQPSPQGIGLRARLLERATKISFARPVSSELEKTPGIDPWHRGRSDVRVHGW